MNSVLVLSLCLIAVTSAYPTSYGYGDPQYGQFYYYNQPSNGHVIRRDYQYPYNQYQYGNENNNYAYGPYGAEYYPYWYPQPNYGTRQPLYVRYDDPYAPSELRQTQQDYLRKDEIDLSGFKLHHQHHPNKDRVGLKPGHDSGVHGVSFSNDGN